MAGAKSDSLYNQLRAVESWCWDIACLLLILFVSNLYENKTLDQIPSNTEGRAARMVLKTSLMNMEATKKNCVSPNPKEQEKKVETCIFNK